MKKISVKDIITCLGDDVKNVLGTIDGIYIDNLADVAHTNCATLDWVNTSKTNKQEIIEKSPARVMLVDESVEYVEGKVLILVKNPKKALAIVGNTFFVERPEPGIHPTAIISPKARIGNNVHIGAYTVIGDAIIGEGTIISPFVKIYDNVTIGRECYFKEGAVIGGEGFGFEKDNDGNRFRFPQIGGVCIGNHVDIGAGTCVDRGALSITEIGDYTKISNQCQIAHNVKIGRNVILTACVEISGSCIIGDGTWVGPNSCIRDGRKVGENSLVGIGSVVVKDIPSNEVWAGNPARYMRGK